MLCVLQQFKSEQGRPCSVLGKHVFLSILMSMLYVSDMHTYLDAVLQQVKREQGRSLQCYANLGHCAAHTVVPCSVLLTLTCCAAPCQ